MTIEVVGFGLAGACLAIQLTKLGAIVRVTDDGFLGSTAVAAGLVNPVTGKNFQPSWRLSDFWPEAQLFYQSLDESLYHPMPIFRRWMDDRDKFQKKYDTVAPWIAEVSEEGVTWKEGGWLETRRFLEVARAWLLEQGVSFEPGCSDSEVQVRCGGSAALRKREFAKIDHRCAKGEILTVTIPDWQEDYILTGGGWLIPIGNEKYRVGATYAWDGLDSGPTEEGREWVERILRNFTKRDYEICDHQAGVRPIIRKSQPVLHYEEELGWLFNGLGSKGVIYAPRVARQLAEHLLDGKAFDPDLRLSI